MGIRSRSSRRTTTSRKPAAAGRGKQRRGATGKTGRTEALTPGPTKQRAKPTAPAAAAREVFDAIREARIGTLQGLGFEVTLHESFDAGLERVIRALKGEGFGIVSRVDMQAVFLEKLGVAFRPYVILGICNPELAHRALVQQPLAGLVLPCNVTVEATAAGNTAVRIGNPIAAMGPLRRDLQLRAVALEARTRLGRVISELQHVIL